MELILENEYVISGLVKFIDRFKTSSDFFMEMEHFELMHLGRKKLAFSENRKIIKCIEEKSRLCEKKTKKIKLQRTKNRLVTVLVCFNLALSICVDTA